MPIARGHVQMTSVLMRQYSCLNRKYYNRRVPRAYVLVSLGPLRSLNAYQVSVSAGGGVERHCSETMGPPRPENSRVREVNA